MGADVVGAVAPPFHDRRGFTLVEAIISTVLGSFVLILVFTVLIVQSQHFSMLEERIQSQDVVRSVGMFVADETVFIPRGGVVLAQPDSFVFRQPITMGIVCAYSGSASDIYLPRADGSLPTGEVAGYGVRAADGTWTFTATSWASIGISYSTAAAGRCATQGADTSGIASDFIPAPSSYAQGTHVLVYRQVALSVATSELDSGTEGLYLGGTGVNRQEVGSYLLPTTHFEYHRHDTNAYYNSVSSTYAGQIDRVRLVVEAQASPNGQPETLTVPIPLFNAQF